MNLLFLTGKTSGKLFVVNMEIVRSIDLAPSTKYTNVGIEYENESAAEYDVLETTAQIRAQLERMAPVVYFDGNGGIAVTGEGHCAVPQKPCRYRETGGLPREEDIFAFDCPHCKATTTGEKTNVGTRCLTCNLIFVQRGN